ncbi:MAG TPA: M3 family metallopeptidase [Nocardioidaceae bacterium]|nr:M3 family metallopeptidase [Nocardioidaceae bacterium]
MPTTAEHGLDPANPFAAPSTLPFQFPDFAAIRFEHYRPAFDAGVAEQAAEVEAIATDPAAPTYANTVEALERSGRLLERMLGVFWNLTSSMADEQMQSLDQQIAPLFAAHQDAIRLDPRLFARIDAVFSERETLDLTPEQRRVLERYHTDFVRNGAALAEPEQERLRALNEQITAAQTEFGNRLLAEANSRAVHVTDPGRLAGLSEDAVDAAEAAATSRGLDGYLLTLVSPTIQPALHDLEDRELRRELHEAAVGRGSSGGDHDTRELLARLSTLRAERAALLGFAHHAEYVAADQTAGSSKAVSDMLAEMVAPAMRNLDTERAQIEQAMAADGVEGPVQPWDWTFYATRVKADRYQVDAREMRPYLELDRVLHDGIFYAARRLYGLAFTERFDLPVYAEGVRIFEVHDEDGSALGLFVCDWFARPTKRGGAWMNEFVGQSRLHGTRPVVVVCLNVPEPPKGHRALMTIDEVKTGFHEFGHALHGLFADADYPRLAGTAVPRDFVEFPSQVNEMWAWHPEVVASYARHYQTDEPLPQELVERLIASRKAGQGFDTVSMLAAALLDQEWHRRTPASEPVSAEDVDAFETAALERTGVRSALVPPRYRSGYFAHAFAGGYDANYYSYLWSEVLDADTVDWFTENGGLRRENGERFRAALLSRGGTVDAMDAFAAVRGRPPSTEPLLRRRGLLEEPGQDR